MSRVDPEGVNKRFVKFVTGKCIMSVCLIVCVTLMVTTNSELYFMGV